MSSGSLLTRIGLDFNKVMDRIDKKRNEMKQKKLSMRKKTDLISKHNSWEIIEEDLINFVMPKNKKGLVTIGLFLFVLISFLAIIILGVYGVIFSQINTALDQNVTFGQVNLQEINNDTFGTINTAFLKNIDLIGYTIIFALIMFMMASAYLLRGTYPKLFIIADIIIMVFVYILSVYVSDAYSTLINSTSILNIFSNNLQKSSILILNLPKIIGIIGAIMMVLTYSSIPKQQDELQIGI